MFMGPYHNLRGNLLGIVMPKNDVLFSRQLTYPDGSKVRYGFDFLAAHYISKALNFKFE